MQRSIQGLSFLDSHIFICSTFCSIARFTAFMIIILDFKISCVDALSKRVFSVDTSQWFDIQNQLWLPQYYFCMACNQL